MNFDGCLVTISPSGIETRSGRRRPVVHFDHAARTATLPQGLVGYDLLAVRLLAPSVSSRPFTKKHVTAFDEAHARVRGQEVQISIKGRSWARLYKGRDAEQLVAELTKAGVRGEQALRQAPRQPGEPSRGMSHFTHGR